MKVDIYKIDGTKTGESVELTNDIFAIEPNDHVIYLSVKAYLANQRQGTHKTKGRSEVSGGGKKPWKQKGRGTARAGTSRSPIWIGGGTIFGPQPRNYRQKINKKVNRLARKSALSIKAKSEQIIVVEDFNFDTPKTQDFVKILDALKLTGKKTLLLTNGTQENIYKSGRNVEKVSVREADKVSAYELLNSQILLLQKGAVEKLESTFN
ncbi:MAG: 50S ribosomal protein L4 [Ignavibacteriae bacterium HGW-Ignavibacteriae-2]|jgi:large subunit ribosomal protein L4|nr:MAG: 50S ribosomal protein L4 [Ignavibacteriae bacterium HGW-Ignavibacteriae-2]